MSDFPLIAIVDDDRAMREALGELLQVAGLACRPYAGALEFLADYAPGRFDLVISDLRMPHMDGVAMIRQMRSAGELPPVLIVTSSSDPVARRWALDAGAFECLTKPIADHRLLALVSDALGQARGGRS